MPDFSSLEEVYGTPFEKRAPETQAAENTSRPATYRKGEDKPRLQNFVESLTNSLPISKEDPNYRVELTEVRKAAPVTRVTENFTGGGYAYAPPSYETNAQISRILKLVEQNRTGYETTGSQDMLLYIFTGVLFLFTFDSFVTLGRQMR